MPKNKQIKNHSKKGPFSKIKKMNTDITNTEAKNEIDREDNYIGYIPISFAVREEIELLMNKGQIIAAIKAVHNATNLGLAMSKSFIDHLPEINWKKCDLDTYKE